MFLHQNLPERGSFHDATGNGLLGIIFVCDHRVLVMYFVHFLLCIFPSLFFFQFFFLSIYFSVAGLLDFESSLAVSSPVRIQLVFFTTDISQYGLFIEELVSFLFLYVNLQ